MVTGEHSGLESPNMPAALAGIGDHHLRRRRLPPARPYTITARALDRPTRRPATRRNIYYNAANWADELNEYNTLYASTTTPIGPTAPAAPEYGHCVGHLVDHLHHHTGHRSVPLASETGIMMSHVLANNPRVGYAHQSNLIGRPIPPTATPC